MISGLLSVTANSNFLLKVTTLDNPFILLKNKYIGMWFIYLNPADAKKNGINFQPSGSTFKEGGVEDRCSLQ